MGGRARPGFVFQHPAAGCSEEENRIRRRAPFGLHAPTNSTAPCPPKAAATRKPPPWGASSKRSALRTAPAGYDPANRNAAYERCVAERRVDCDVVRYGTGGDVMYGYTGSYGPQFVLGARNFPPGCAVLRLESPATPSVSTRPAGRHQHCAARGHRQPPRRRRAGAQQPHRQPVPLDAHAR